MLDCVDQSKASAMNELQNVLCSDVNYVSQIVAKASVVPSMNVTIAGVTYYFKASIHHHGMLSKQGHYTAYVLNDDGSLIHIDDSKVMKSLTQYHGCV